MTVKTVLPAEIIELLLVAERFCFRRKSQDRAFISDLKQAVRAARQWVINNT